MFDKMIPRIFNCVRKVSKVANYQELFRIFALR
jgi:hypothetical protein